MELARVVIEISVKTLADARIPSFTGADVWYVLRLKFPHAMSRTSHAEEETPNLRDQRTIFVGNLPIELASKRVSRYHFPPHLFLPISNYHN